MSVQNRSSKVLTAEPTSRAIRPGVGGSTPYSAPMLILSIVLTVLGAVLSVLGVYWGALKTVREYKALKTDLAKLHAIAADPDIDGEERTLRRHAIRRPTGTWGSVEYFEENSQLAALELVVHSLKWPALLTVAGVLVGSVANVVSLWA